MAIHKVVLPFVSNILGRSFSFSGSKIAGISTEPDSVFQIIMNLLSLNSKFLSSPYIPLCISFDTVKENLLNNQSFLGW